jgi:hypothetical protein
MISEIEESLRNIERHTENINELLPGLPDEWAEDFLAQVQTAEDSMESAHGFLVR